MYCDARRSPKTHDAHSSDAASYLSSHGLLCGRRGAESLRRLLQRCGWLARGAAGELFLASLQTDAASDCWVVNLRSAVRCSVHTQYGNVLCLDYSLVRYV